jgi:hypothetical protein
MGLTVFSTFVMADFLFLAGGALLLGFALVEQSEKGETSTKANVVRNLLLVYSPATAAIVNAVTVFVAFVISIPGLILPSTRGWLKFFGAMVLGNALFTMIIGLVIWFHTLHTRSEFSSIWAQQTNTTQSFLQQSLDCCGYENSTSPPFVTDSTCTDAARAAVLGGCISAFSSEANLVLDQIFTGAFAIVGIDAVTFLAILMLLQDRKEKERYRHIDEKNGSNGF